MGPTPREKEVIELVLEGCTNREISERLGMAQRTVKGNLSRIFLKFNIRQDRNKKIELIAVLQKQTKREKVEIQSSLLACRGNARFPRKESRRPSIRQNQVMKLVAKGFTNTVIGAKMGITESVVKNYLRVIYDEVGVWNRLELTLWYNAHREQRL